MDRITGYDYWMFFFTQTLTWLFTIPRRGVFLLFYVIFSKIVINGHTWSTKVTSGPDALKNDNIWSDLII